jgi:WD40 repeat protein
MRQFSASSWIRCRVFSDRVTNSFGRKRFGALTSSLRGHRGSIYSIDWSKQRNIIVSGSADRSIMFWDVDTGHITGKIDGHSDFVRAVAFSPDHLKVASASKDNTVRIWDSITGSQLLLLCGHTNNVWSISWSPNGDYVVSGSSDFIVKVWDCTMLRHVHDPVDAHGPGGYRTDEDRCIATFSMHTRGVMCVRWQAQGNYIASVGIDATIILYRVSWSAEGSDGDRNIQISNEAPIRYDTGGVFMCEWSSKGDILATGGINGIIKFFRSENIDEDSTSVEHTKWVECLSLNNGNLDHVSSLAFGREDAFIMSGSYTGNLYIWDIENKALVYYTAVYGIIYSVLFSPHDTNVFAVCSQSGKIDLYHVEGINNPEVIMPALTLPDNSGTFQAEVQQAADPEGPVDYIRYVPAALNDDTVAECDNEVHRQMKTLDSSIVCLSYSPGGDKLASAHAQGNVIVWDMTSGNKTTVLNMRTNNTRLAWSSTGDKLVCGGDSSVSRIVHIGTGQTPVQLVGHCERVTSLYWCARDRFILSSSVDGTLKLWNAETGVVVAECKGQGKVRNMALHYRSHNSLSLAFSDDLSLKHLKRMDVELTVAESDADSSEEVQVAWLPGHNLEGISNIVVRVAFNNAGSSVAGGCINEKIYVWDVDSANLLYVLSGHAHVIWAMCWSVDDSRIYSGDRLGVMLSWDTTSGRLLQKYQYPSLSVCSCDVSPARKFIAAGLSDGTISVLNPDIFVPVTSYYVGKVIIRVIDITPCGSWIASGYQDGFIRIFSVAAMDLVYELKMHALELTGLAFTKNGKRLLSSGAEGNVCCWKFELGDPEAHECGGFVIGLLHKISRPYIIRTLCLSPCEKYVAFAGHGKCIEIVDIESMSTVGAMSLTNWVIKLAWNPAGTEIAAACLSKYIPLCSMKSFIFRENVFPSNPGPGYRPLVRHLTGHEGNVFDVDWNPVNKMLLSVAVDLTIKIWNPEVTELLMTLDCSNSCGRTAMWSRDGSNRIVSSGTDHCVRIWDSFTGICTAELCDHSDFVFMVKFWTKPDYSTSEEESADSSISNSTMILSCSADSTIRIWDSALL